MEFYRGLYQPVPGKFARYFRIDFAYHFANLPKPTVMTVAVIEPDNYLRLPGGEYREAQQRIADQAIALANEQITERGKVQNLEPWLVAKMTERVVEDIEQALRLGII